MGQALSTGQVWELNISFYAKGIYCLLYKFADKKGKCWPSIRKLKELSGLSKPTILKAIYELKAANLIEIQPRYRDDGTCASNNYILKKPKNLIADTVNVADRTVKEIDGDGKGDLPGVVNDVDTMNLSNMNLSNRTNIYSIFEHWNSKKIIVHKELNEATKSCINARLDAGNTVEEIIEAINNYEQILRGDKWYWSYKWGLKDFLTRGLDQFRTENDPFKNFEVKADRFTKPKGEVPLTEQDDEYWGYQ